MAYPANSRALLCAILICIALPALSDCASAALLDTCPSDGDTLTTDTNYYSTLECAVGDAGNNGVIVIGAQGITLDCNGMKMIGGSLGYAIYNNGYDNVTIKNCNIGDYARGIQFQGADNANILDNNIQMSDYGFYLYGSTDANIHSNEIGYSLYYGLYLTTDANRHSITDNNLSNNSRNGIYVTTGSGDSNIFRNEISYNGSGTGGYGGIYILAGSGDLNIADNNFIANNPSGMYLGSGSSTIADNNIQRNVAYGMALYTSHSNTVLRNTISATNFGITMNRANNLIQGNTIRRTLSGIYLTGAAATDNNICFNTIDQNNKYGIQLYVGPTRNSITDNNISDNNVYGIYARHTATDTNIHGNEISYNGRGGSTDSGVYIMAANNDMNISDNNMNGNNRYAVYAGARVAVMDNNINSSVTYAIRLQGGSDHNILRNVIYGPSTIGVYTNNANNRISGNIIRQVTYGLYVTSSAATDTNIHSNTLDRGQGNSYGIYFLNDANRASITDNNISSNIKYGIMFYRAGDCNISRNEISYNAQGIYGSGGDWNIADNNIIGNSNGIYANGSRANTITDNNIQNNTDCGIRVHLAPSKRQTIRGNIISGNTNDGIYISAASDINILDNNLSANGRYGLFPKNAFDLNIYNNDISYNGNTGLYTDTQGNVDINLTKCTVQNNATQDIYLEDTNIIFLDGNYGSITFLDINAKVERKWYVDVNVADASTNLPISGASVDITDQYSSAVGSTLATAGDGSTARQEITEFDQNKVSLAPYYYTPHTFSASMASYDSNNYLGDVDQNLELKIYLSPPPPPDVNITKIDGYPDDEAMPAYFRYANDGNLTVDFNIGNITAAQAYVDIYYSKSQNSFENSIYDDLNLSGFKADPDSLVGYWRFDNNTAYDYSGNGNNAIDTNATYVPYGAFGGAFAFVSGDNNGIQVADSSTLDINGDLTVMLWVYLPAAVTSKKFLYKGNNYILGVDSSNHPYFSVFSESGTECKATSDGELVPGMWHSMHGKYRAAPEYGDNTGNSYLNIDGADTNALNQECIMGTTTVSIATNDLNLVIGENADANIDEAMLFSRMVYGTESGDVYDSNNMYYNLCQDLNFTDSTWCRWDFNISGVADGNYFIDINAWDALDSNGTGSSDSSFEIWQNPTMDANVAALDGFSDTNAGNIFSYYRDANVTIDFNVSSTSNTHSPKADINYSIGQGDFNYLIVKDMDLTAIDSGMKGYWHFNMGDINSDNWVQDATTNDRDGRLVGSTSYTAAGKFKGALTFNGSSDYVDLPASNSMLTDSPFTLSAWIKTDAQQGSYGTEGRIINLHRLNAPSFSTGGTIYAGGPAGGEAGDNDDVCFLFCSTDAGAHLWLCYQTTSPNTYHNGDWHLITATHDGSTAKLYYDGAEVGTKEGAYGTFGTTQAKIGSYDGTARFFEGTIDEPAVYNRVLSADEIKKTYLGTYNNCADSNFTEATRCSWDWNIHSSLVSDGNYFIDINFHDDIFGDENYSDYNYTVDNTKPIIWTDHNTAWQSTDANIVAYEYFDVNFAIAAANDDCYIIGNNTKACTNDYQGYGDATSLGGADSNQYYRWSLNMPKGSTIMSAYIAEQADSSANLCSAYGFCTGDFTVKIQLMDSDNQGSFDSGSPWDVATAGSVDYSPAAWSDGTWYNTSDITTLVQSYIDRSGYASGNYIGIRIFHNNVANDKANFVTSYDGGQPPRLHVIYRVPLTATADVYAKYRKDSNSTKTASLSSWAEDNNILYTGDGNWAWEFRLHDIAGNLSDVNSGYALIGTTKPKIYLYEPLDENTTVTSQVVRFDVNKVSISGIDVSAIEVDLNGTPSAYFNATTDCTASDGNYVCTYTELGINAPGDWNVSVFAKDMNCYPADQNTSIFTVSNFVPGIEVIDPNGNIGDGNVSGVYSIDFNWSDLGETETDVNASLWYSSSAYGYTNLIDVDVNLLDPDVCTDADSDQSTDQNCTYSWDTTDGEADGNYFLDIRIFDGTDFNADSSDANWALYNKTKNEITISNSPMNFNLSVGKADENGASDLPFLIENTGTTILDVSTDATSISWAGTPDVNYYKFIADNNEAGSCSTFDQSDWNAFFITGAPGTNKGVCQTLSNVAGNDEINMGIKVNCPLDEPTTTSTTSTVTLYIAEDTTGANDALVTN